MKASLLQLLETAVKGLRYPRRIGDRRSAGSAGLKAREMTAWGEAPGNPAHNDSSLVGAKQRARGFDHAVQGSMVPPFQGLSVAFIDQTQGFTQGGYITGLQPNCP
jgi:hypothetical protein